jgi:hypothetical protein
LRVVVGRGHGAVRGVDGGDRGELDRDVGVVVEELAQREGDVAGGEPRRSGMRLPDGASWWASVPPPASLPITITS